MCAICSLRLDGCSTAAFLFASYGLPMAAHRQQSRLRGTMLLWRRIAFANRCRETREATLFQ